MDNILHIIHNTSTTLVATVTNITFVTDTAIQHHANFSSLGLDSDFTATTTATSYTIPTNSTVSFNLGYTAKGSAVNNRTYASTLTIIVTQDLVPTTLKVLNYIPIGAAAPAGTTNTNYVGDSTGVGSPGGSGGVSVPGLDLPIFSFILLGLDVQGVPVDNTVTEVVADIAPKNPSVEITDIDGSIKSFNIVVSDAETVKIPGVYDGIGDGGYDYSGGCPDPNTLIMISPTSSVPASSLNVGDIIYTMHEGTMDFGYFKVGFADLQIQDKVKVSLVDNTQIIVSTSHIFLLDNNRWKPMYDIKVGDLIKGIDGSKKISQIEPVETGEVVKFIIEGAHTYIAAGLISHNKNLENFEMDQQNGMDGGFNWADFLGPS